MGAALAAWSSPFGVDCDWVLTGSSWQLHLEQAFRTMWFAKLLPQSADLGPGASLSRWPIAGGDARLCQRRSVGSQEPGWTDPRSIA